MRIAVLADIHGNLPALDAVLADVDRAGVDAIVLAGDVAAGPMPVATLDRLAERSDVLASVMGNGDREMVEAFEAIAAGGRPQARFQVIAWAAEQLDRAHRNVLAAY